MRFDTVFLPRLYGARLLSHPISRRGAYFRGKMSPTRILMKEIPQLNNERDYEEFFGFAIFIHKQMNSIDFHNEVFCLEVHFRKLWLCKD